MENPTRRYPRVNRLFLISFVNREGEEQRTPVSMGKTIDVSPAGIGMEVHAEIRAGSVMEMEIDLQDSILAVKGKVVHVKRQEEGRSVIGIEFDAPQQRLAAMRSE